MLDGLTIKDAFYGMVAIIAGIVVIRDFLSPYFSIKTKYDKEFDNFKLEIKKEFSDVKTSLNNLEEHKEEQRELMQLVLEGVTASLYAHKENGNNGPVTIAIERIEEYKNKRAVS